MVASIARGRFEKKFIPGRLAPAEVASMIRRHPAAFREVFPPRVVHNIYVDTPARSLYWDHVRGASPRSKYRVRWYDWADGTVSAPVLEHKSRCGALCEKATYTLEAAGADPLELAFKLPGLEDGVALPPLVQLALQHTEPALVNRYRRAYYLSGSGRIRLTVDSCLEYCGVDGASGNRAPGRRDPVSVVLELKYDPEHHDEAAVVTNGLPFRLARFSKYCRGIEATIGRMSNSGSH
jgi:hypothetical protein